VQLTFHRVLIGGLTNQCIGVWEA